MPTSLVNTIVVKIRYLHRKMRNCRDQKLTVNVLYLACMIFGIFQNFCYLMVFDLVVDLYPLIQTFINAHLAVYLILREDSTAKGTKKNTSPNVVLLQYFPIYIDSYTRMSKTSNDQAQNICVN